MNRVVNAIPQAYLKDFESFMKLGEIFTREDILVLPQLSEKQNDFLEKAMSTRKVINIDYDSLYKNGLDPEDQMLVLCHCKLGGDTEHNAARLAVKLGKLDLVFWNEEKLYDSDIRYVKTAKSIEHLSYGEATELSFFGSKLLHSPHFAPAIEQNLPVRLACLDDPKAKGTIIDNQVSPNSSIVCGFGLIENVSLLNIEGPLMSGVPGVSSKLFTALSEQNISVIMISQASSEYSICLAVDADVAQRASEAAKLAMGMLFADMIEVKIIPDCAIIAAVGENMAGSVGVSAKVFTSLANSHVSARSISQGSLERNISVVVDHKDVGKALAGLHDTFFSTPKTRLIIAGAGNVASSLMSLLKSRKDIRVVAICNSKSALMDPFSHDDWSKSLLEAPRQSLESVMDETEYDILVDCTASSTIGDLYDQVLGSGHWIVSANKQWASRSKTDISLIGHEATVGAGLPLMRTLKALKDTGDEILEIKATLSGTLSWIFSQFDKTTSFSGLVLKAHEMGYTEPDPRMDLSGCDVSRKAVILAKEMGLDASLDQVKVESLVPKELEDVSKEEFLEKLCDYDDYYQSLIKGPKKLCYMATVSKDRLECSLQEQESSSSSTANTIVIYTKAYKDGLTIQGPGAGSLVTSYGVLADILDWRKK